MATHPLSLDELLKGVPPDKLDKPCRDIHLCDISLKIADWKFIAPFLHISEVVQKEIESEGSIGTQRVAMLRRWKKKYGRRATYRKLATVFRKLERADLVDKICDALTHSDSSSDSDEEEALTDRTILDKYTDHLRHTYPKEIPSFVQWPPPPTRKFFNLAMIHRRPIQVGPIDEKHIRWTQLGNVDDIMLNKTAIQLKDIFHVSTELARRMIVLVEGAPGAGKSTLAWYICDQWSSGNLFCEFKLVIFVQLRSPAVQSATSVADLLPRMANGKEREVLSSLESRYGKGILFVLDGWDEYTGGLTQDSICGKLICSPAALSMQESTLLITSRPIASGELQQYCLTRIEIIGFAPKEVKEYFKDALRVAHQAEQQAEVLQECLKVRPVIQASCYLPLNAAIVVHLFMAEGNTLPTTLHGLFTSLVLNCIVRHLMKTRQKEGRRMSKITSFESIPAVLQPHFNAICALAFHGIMKNKASFSEEELLSFHLSTESSAPLLSLIQGWSSFKSSWEELSYSFFHLSVQELLAAFYISKQSHKRQVAVFRKLFGQPRFAAVLTFYAAFTKFVVEGIRNLLREILQESPRIPLPGFQMQGYPLLPAHSSLTFGSSRFQQLPEISSHSRSELHKTILDCLYEAQDPALCQYIASVMGSKLTVDYMMSPFHCMAFGYFLHCLCLTPGGGKFHIEITTSGLDEYHCSYLINELKKCSHGQLALSMDECGEVGSFLILLPMLQQSCSHCISELSLSLKGQGYLFDKALLNECYRIPVVSLCIYRDASVTERMLDASSTYSRYLPTLSADERRTQFEALAASLATTSIQQLSISNCNFHLKDLEVLADSLTANKTLSLFSLSNCTFPLNGSEALADCLANSTTLLTLHVSQCMSETDLSPLAHSLVKNTTLRTLDISGCTLSLEGVRALASWLAGNSVLETLNLKGCKLSRARRTERLLAESCRTILRTPLNASSVRELPRNNQSENLGIEAMPPAPKVARGSWMVPNSSAEKLSVEQLAASLCSNKTLRCLNLSMCWIARPILPFLPKALAVNNTLQTLVLSNNSLIDVDVDNVTTVLKLKSSLKTLDLSACLGSSYNPQKVEFIVTACHSLKTLILSYNDLSKGAYYLAQGLRQNKSLRSLIIACCSLNDSTMRMIVEALEQNPSLQELDFSDNKLTDRGFRNLSKRLQKISCLQKVTPCS